MRAISLFSGAGGFELGFERAGIETVLQAESDPVCLSVLERHWPQTERVDDVRKVDAATLQGRCRDVVGVGSGTHAQRLGESDRRRDDTDDIDLVYGGFPCQDVSVAGNRAGLRGERSSLWFEFERVLSELRPRWVCIENVPGLLSSGAEPGADFGVVLRGLVDLGYGVAWRVLDARWFGVPQRRRRVFVVGCLGDAPRAQAVLAVCACCGGHPQTGSETREDVAYALAASPRGTGDGHGNAWNTTYVNGLYDADPDGVSRPLVARESGYRMDLETENFLVASAVRASDGHHGHSSPRGDGADNLIAFHMTQDPINSPESPALGGNAYLGVSSAAGVRRLTPLECERLMGWPDEHTRYTADGKEIPDSHRYKMCGNGVVATVAEWIGHRLARANWG